MQAASLVVSVADGASGVQVVGNKWELFLSLLQEDYSEGYAMRWRES